MRRGHAIITNVLPAYFLFKRAIIGSFSLTTNDERYLLNGCLVDYNGITETPGYHFGQICKDIKFPKKNPHNDNLAYPYKAIPGKHPYAFYIDVSKAFFQIANVFGMETSHSEGSYMALGATQPPPVFAEQKLMRSLFVSGTQKTSKFTEWINHDIRNREFPNRNYAPCLSRTIFATLHAIQSLVDEDSIYCHTDGFIVPFYRFDRTIRKLENHRITFSVKGEGRCEIFNVGAYRIGDKSTKRTQHRRGHTDNIRHTHRNWWLKQWERGLDYRGI